MKIEIISREQIKPSSPTPSHLRNYKLSLFDQISPPFYFPLTLFYSSEETNKVNQSEASSTLKSSLSDALTQFYPLAGRMEGKTSVDCNDQGADYIEARVETCLSDIIERPEIDELNQLIPYDFSDKGLSVEKQLLIQVSFFNCGGIAIGACMSHRIADGCTFSTFLTSWAAHAQGNHHMVCPSFISASLFPPRESLGFTPQPPIPEQGLVTRRLVFSALSIASLRARVSPGWPTRVEIVTALIWKGLIGQNRSTSMVFHPVNIRRRMVPALPDHSCGNLFLMADAVTEGEEDLSSLNISIRKGTSFILLTSPCTVIKHIHHQVL